MKTLALFCLLHDSGKFQRNCCDYRQLVPISYVHYVTNRCLLHAMGLAGYIQPSAKRTHYQLSVDPSEGFTYIQLRACEHDSLDLSCSAIFSFHGKQYQLTHREHETGKPWFVIKVQ